MKHPFNKPTFRKIPIHERLWFHPVAFGASLFLLLSAGAVFAGNETNLFDLSLDQLTKVEIKSDITSILAKPIREQPGIVSVVTQEEIREIGAGDLSDVLMLVPGFSLDSDVESMVGLTFRGLQGQEGKVLLIVDGLEVNEPLYGSLPILNHIRADSIEEVEIIRGPGSAMYGGTAALAVIRVTTKGAGNHSAQPTDGGCRPLLPLLADDSPRIMPWGPAILPMAGGSPSMAVIAMIFFRTSSTLRWGARMWT